MNPVTVIDNKPKKEFREDQDTLKSVVAIDDNVESKPKSEDNIVVDDNNLDILKLPIFSQVIDELPVKETVIVSLKLGYIDKKCYSSDEIAEFLDIKKEEVLETTKAALLLYKEKANCFFDDAMQKIVNDGGEGKVLFKASDKSVNNA